MVTIELERPIESLTLASDANQMEQTPEAVDRAASKPKPSGASNTGASEGSTQKQNLDSVFEALHTAARELKHAQQNIIKEHKQQIAKLAVEIARKVLMQQVKDSDYKIESIIQEALNNVPTHKDIVVHLNPEDFAQCQISEAENKSDGLTDLKLVPDPNVGKAECLVETPKGVLESIIEEHLENISKALTNAE